jgi:hypothetical protein
MVMIPSGNTHQIGKRGGVMERIAWLDSFEEGLEMARADNKLVFADFLNPN